MGRVEKFAKVHFCNREGQPEAPPSWPKGLHVPIAVYSKLDDLKKGDMERFGFDLVVCAFYLAWAWSVKKGLEDSGFARLGRNALFDFQYFENPDAMFVEATSLLERSESMREFFGLDQSRMVLLVMQTKKMLQKKGQAATPAAISQFLKESIQWSSGRRCPSEETVKQLTQIGAMIQKSERARLAMAVAESQWGRDTIFDETSKVGRGRGMMEVGRKRGGGGGGTRQQMCCVSGFGRGRVGVSRVMRCCSWCNAAGP